MTRERWALYNKEILKNELEKHLHNFKVYEPKIDKTKSTITVGSFNNLSVTARTSRPKKLGKI